MCKCDTNFFLIMPSPRKRIGFLPSEEVHEIIEKFCIANEFSQSKVTGLLVEEALRSRGVLNLSFGQNDSEKGDLINFSFDQETLTENIKSFNSLAVAQLHHAGMRSPEDIIGERPVCPSSDDETNSRALTLDEVKLHWDEKNTNKRNKLLNIINESF